MRLADFSALAACTAVNGVPHLEHALAVLPPLARHAGFGQTGFAAFTTGTATGLTARPKDLVSIPVCALTACGCFFLQRLQKVPFFFIGPAHFQHAQRFAPFFDFRATRPPFFFAGFTVRAGAAALVTADGAGDAPMRARSGTLTFSEMSAGSSTAIVRAFFAFFAGPAFALGCGTWPERPTMYAISRHLAFPVTVAGRAGHEGHMPLVRAELREPRGACPQQRHRAGSRRLRRSSSRD